MFFGVQLKPTSPSSLKLAKTLKLSNAVLVPAKNGAKEPVQVVADYENKQFILCILNHNTTIQCPLDILFAPGSDVKLSVKGSGTVHLTGYEVEDESDEDIPDMSDSSGAEEEGEEEEESKEAEVESSDGDEDETEALNTRHKMIKTSGKKTIVNGSDPKPSKARRVVPKKVEVDEGEGEDEGSSEDDDFDIDDLEDESNDDEEDDEDMLSEEEEEELSGEDDMSDEEMDN